MRNFTDTEVALIERFREEYDVPGIAVALVQDRAIVAEGGFGHANLDSGNAPTAHTAWPIASVTKSFTAVAAMQCVEDGLLDLDLPVRNYLPSLLVADEAATAQLTIRRLLTHTSGLGRTGHQDRTREEAVNPYPTREALVAALPSAVPQAPIGQCFSYSNESYTIAGHVIETVRGQSLEDCFDSLIFTPLGMQHTVTRFCDWRSATDRAVLYAGANIGPYGSGNQHGNYQVVELVTDYQTFLSTGGIASTAHDLALYQIASMDYERSPLGLSAAALRHMQSAQHLFGDSGFGYGLGYWVMPIGDSYAIGHSGGLPGVSTYSLMLPNEGVGVVVLTNRSDIKAMVLAERLAGAMRGELWRTDTQAPMPVQSAWAAPNAQDLEPFLGSYRFRRGPAAVKPGETGVIIETPSRYDGPVVTLHTRRIARDRFACLNDGHVIDFTRNAAGEVEAFLHSGYKYTRD